MIDIYVFSEEKAWSKRLKNKNLFFKQICNSFPKKYKFTNKKVSFSLMLSNNKNIKKLNNIFRNKDKPTDILSFPTSKKRMYKYILICLIYLSLIQIFRIMSLAICLKYLPQYWIILHSYSSYLFFYPCALIMWYHFSSKTNVINQKY